MVKMACEKPLLWTQIKPGMDRQTGMKPGDRVKVMSGPWSGTIGILEETTSQGIHKLRLPKTHLMGRALISPRDEIRKYPNHRYLLIIDRGYEGYHVLAYETADEAREGANYHRYSNSIIRLEIDSIIEDDDDLLDNLDPRC
jgi:hypothetical protein